MTYEKKSVIELREIAKERKIKGISTLKKQELIKVLENYDQEQSKQKEEPQIQREPKQSYSEHQERKHHQKEFPKNIKSLDSGEKAHGILEVMPDGYGFIRCENYLPGENDIYVSPAQIRKFNLKTGDILTGAIRIKTQSEKFSALLFVESVNGYKPEMAARRQHFEDLTPIFPNERLGMETERSSIPMRMVDLLSPVGKGQRGMIVSPPKTGKTTLLKQMAQSISQNYKDIKLIVLLIDERPEEVTDFKESIEGKNVEVIYSTFDELPEHHKRVSEMVLERAKRLVEHKARNMREGGSLTILATALVETGSKMDDVIFEEFKGTGNMELVLNRRLAEKRIFPAVDIAKSGTRREELLLTKDEREVVTALHKELSGNRSEEFMEQMLDLFKRTQNNKEFVALTKRSLLRK